MKFTVEMTTRGVDLTRFEQVYFSDAFNREVMHAVHLKQRSGSLRIRRSTGINGHKPPRTARTDLSSVLLSAST